MNQPTPFPLAGRESQIELRHPHIFRHLSLVWGAPEGARYLEGLLVDGRGERTGFSKEVFAELLGLFKIYPVKSVPAPTIVANFERSRRRLTA
jgi:hypothetical protein